MSSVENSSAEALPTQDIQSQLDDFARKTEEYARFCEEFQSGGNINLADIMLPLGEAATEAESFFSAHSHEMDMEQLQRYGQLQSRLDSLTLQLFEADITRNQQIVLSAMENGDYFIVNLTYNAIKSSIYMIYAKARIKTQQDERLAAMQQNLEIAQTFIKVLKALESVLAPEPAVQDFGRIQKALNIYCDYFQNAETVPLKQASDQRVFNLFAAHAEALQHAQPPNWRSHLVRCRELLKRLASHPGHHSQLAGWEKLFNVGSETWTETAPTLATESIPEKAVDGPQLDVTLARHLGQLARLMQIELIEEINFSELESHLADFIMELLAERGQNSPGHAGHRVFALFEEYIDFLSNVDFAGDHTAAGEHIARCCKLLNGLAQSEAENQMLEAWQAIPDTLSVMMMQRGLIY